MGNKMGRRFTTGDRSAPSTTRDDCKESFAIFNAKVWPVKRLGRISGMELIASWRRSLWRSGMRGNPVKSLGEVDEGGK